MADKIRAHLLISGRVQGVFFRYSMQQVANREGVSGWVQNCMDGSVEAVVEGEKTKVENVIRWAQQGSPSAIVRKVEVELEDCAGEFSDFSVKHGW